VIHSSLGIFRGIYREGAQRGMAATKKYYREDAQRSLRPQPKEFYREGAKLAKLREAGSRSGHCFSAPLRLCVRSFFNGFQIDSSRTTSKRGIPEVA
jgi:hypothetical protein